MNEETTIPVVEEATAAIALDFKPRTKILLSAFRNNLREQKIFSPVPSDEWFYLLFKTGEIEARKIGGRWFVYEDSVIAWLKALDQCAVAA